MRDLGVFDASCTEEALQCVDCMREAAGVRHGYEISSLGAKLIGACWGIWVSGRECVLREHGSCVVNFLLDVGATTACDGFGDSGKGGYHLGGILDLVAL